MKLKHTLLDQEQMVSSLIFLRNSIPWIIAVLVSLFLCSSFPSYGSLFLLITTSLVLIFSTFLFKFSKQKQILEEKSVQENLAQENGVDHISDYLAIRPPGSYSESESTDQSSISEDSNVNWPCYGDMGPIRSCSDDFSDEESLIEIELPSGHSVSPKEEEEELKFEFQEKLPKFMEMLAEINEMNEENLIEIDISMGSIKCSRFEIEA